MKRTIKEIMIKNQEPVIRLDCTHQVDLSFTDTEDDLKVGDIVDCLFCENLVFPESVYCYKKSPQFTPDSIPKGFLKSHSTKAGVWAKIVIDNGQLLYVLDDLNKQKQLLDEHTNGVIVPQMQHHITSIGNVDFHVEFYQARG